MRPGAPPERSTALRDTDRSAALPRRGRRPPGCPQLRSAAPTRPPPLCAEIRQPRSHRSGDNSRPAQRSPGPPQALPRPAHRGSPAAGRGSACSPGTAACAAAAESRPHHLPGRSGPAGTRLRAPPPRCPSRPAPRPPPS